MSDQISGLIAVQYFLDQSGNLTTATPVDLDIVPGPYHQNFVMPQDGCLRAIISQIETTPAGSNPDLVTDLTIGGTEQEASCAIAIGATKATATFANGEHNIDKDDVVGASIEMTGGTINDAVDEVSVILIIQLGRSNI
ncbi:MAG: hypothetical protein V3R87_04770 [Dehalococcoidia bacterium]